METPDYSPLEITKLVINNQTKTELLRSTPLKTYSKKQSFEECGSDGKSRYGRMQKRNVNDDYISTDSKVSHYLKTEHISRSFYTRSPKKEKPAYVSTGKPRGRPRKSLNLSTCDDELSGPVNGDPSNIFGSELDFQAPAPTSTETLPLPVELKTKLEYEAEKIESEDNEWGCGDLVWACIEGFPYWPCAIMKDPLNDIFRKTRCYGRSPAPVLMLHVRFFGDNGRRSWVKATNVMPYKGFQHYKTMAEEVCIPDVKKTDFRLYKMFTISRSLKNSWVTAVQEAELLMDSSRLKRIEHFVQNYPESFVKKEIIPAEPIKKRKGRKRKSELINKSLTKKARSDIIRSEVALKVLTSFQKEPTLTFHPQLGENYIKTISIDKNAVDSYIIRCEEIKNGDQMLSNIGLLPGPRIKRKYVKKSSYWPTKSLVSNNVPEAVGKSDVVTVEVSNNIEDARINLETLSGKKNEDVSKEKENENVSKEKENVIAPKEKENVIVSKEKENVIVSKEKENANVSKEISPIKVLDGSITEPVPVKRKRGRPPLKKNLHIYFSKTQGEKIAPVVCNESTQKGSIPIVSKTPESTKEPEIVKVKRPRGRPRKKPLLNNSISVVPSENKKVSPVPVKIYPKRHSAPIIPTVQKNNNVDKNKQEKPASLSKDTSLVKNNTVLKKKLINKERKVKPSTFTSLSGFDAYYEQNSDRIFDENPNLSMSDVEKYLQLKWKEMPDFKRARYCKSRVNCDSDSEDVKPIITPTTNPLALPSVKGGKRMHSLFVGVKVDRVCNSCFKGGKELMKCRGPCAGYYHKTCGDKREVIVKEEKKPKPLLKVEVKGPRKHSKRFSGPKPDARRSLRLIPNKAIPSDSNISDESCKTNEPQFSLGPMFMDDIDNSSEDTDMVILVPEDSNSNSNLHLNSDSEIVNSMFDTSLCSNDTNVDKDSVNNGVEINDDSKEVEEETKMVNQVGKQKGVIMEEQVDVAVHNNDNPPEKGMNQVMSPRKPLKSYTTIEFVDETESGENSKEKSFTLLVSYEVDDRVSDQLASIDNAVDMGPNLSQKHNEVSNSSSECIQHDNVDCSVVNTLSVKPIEPESSDKTATNVENNSKPIVIEIKNGDQILKNPQKLNNCRTELEEEALIIQCNNLESEDLELDVSNIGKKNCSNVDAKSKDLSEGIEDRERTLNDSGEPNLEGASDQKTQSSGVDTAEECTNLEANVSELEIRKENSTDDNSLKTVVQGKTDGEIIADISKETNNKLIPNEQTHCGQEFDGKDASVKNINRESHDLKPDIRELEGGKKNGESNSMEFQNDVSCSSGVDTVQTSEEEILTVKEEICSDTESVSADFSKINADISNKSLDSQQTTVSSSNETDSDNAKGKGWMCNVCFRGLQDSCFICTEITKEETFKCHMNSCGKVYHPSCLLMWPQTHHSESAKGKMLMTCPQHACHTCISDDPQANMPKLYNDKLVRCVLCPTSYHHSNFCIPAGSEIISNSQMICPRHYNATGAKHLHHINAAWCFICSMGGTLICCDLCPNSFHLECLKISRPEGGFVCEDCETGRYPLYGEIVWVKLGPYRWWPAQILFPFEVPENINLLPHQRGEFAVKFFGSHDHYWVNRGRAFLYHEGDGEVVANKNRVDILFNKAMKEASAAFSLLDQERMEREAIHRQAHKPPKYVKIQNNKYIGNVKMPEIDKSNSTPCDCKSEQKSPCGPSSDCINRLLLIECDPETCPAQDKCCNQNFEKRLYPPLAPFKTESRGWGLKTLAPLKKGDFVIEYVGEIIDETEYRRRLTEMQKKKCENYYFLTIDKDRMLDAGPKGNKARFMNHSCSPNCETQKWTVNGVTRVGLFALKDVSKDEELVFNYQLETIGNTKVECKCNAPNCSGFIGGKALPKVNGDIKKIKNKVERKRGKKRLIKCLEEDCFVCKERGDLRACDAPSCPKFYHLKCVGLSKQPSGEWLCPSHQCAVCQSNKVQMCVMCPNAYCSNHSAAHIRFSQSDPVGLVCKKHPQWNSSNKTSGENKNRLNSEISSGGGSHVNPSHLTNGHLCPAHD